MTCRGHVRTVWGMTGLCGACHSERSEESTQPKTLRMEDSRDERISTLRVYDHRSTADTGAARCHQWSFQPHQGITNPRFHRISLGRFQARPYPGTLRVLRWLPLLGQLGLAATRIPFSPWRPARQSPRGL